MEKLEHSFVAGGNGKWYTTLEKISFLKRLKRVTLRLKIPLLVGILFCVREVKIYFQKPTMQQNF
jgi:hypothetical protein